MPRGVNPNSHNNRPKIKNGVASALVLPENQWSFLKVIGRGNKSEGAREVVRSMEIVAKRNWLECANVLGCDPRPETLEARLLELFPGIEKGRKNQANLIQEIALGECSLCRAASFEGKIIRVVNLVTVAVIDGDRKLVESYQKLASGEVFPRGIEGIAEKIQFPEEPEAAARRGLYEELNVIPATLEFIFTKLDKNQKTKYQVIESFAKRHHFLATLKPEDIKEQYEEDWDGDLTVFNWVQR